MQGSGKGFSIQNRTNYDGTRYPLDQIGIKVLGPDGELIFDTGYLSMDSLVNNPDVPEQGRWEPTLSEWQLIFSASQQKERYLLIYGRDSTAGIDMTDFYGGLFYFSVVNDD